MLATAPTQPAAWTTEGWPILFKHANRRVLMARRETAHRRRRRDSPDVIARQIAQSHKNMFNSCLIVHDQFRPTDIVKTIWFTLQSSATMCVFSPYV